MSGRRAWSIVVTACVVLALQAPAVETAAAADDYSTLVNALPAEDRQNVIFEGRDGQALVLTATGPGLLSGSRSTGILSKSFHAVASIATKTVAHLEHPKAHAPVVVAAAKVEPTPSPTPKATPKPIAHKTPVPRRHVAAKPKPIVVVAQVTATPTAAPTATPTLKPTPKPIARKTAAPRVHIAAKPTPGPVVVFATPVPTPKPTPPPTERPTLPPTPRPTAPPTERPTLPPTSAPRIVAAVTPAPTSPPTPRPTLPPTPRPTLPPTPLPTLPPTPRPTLPPTARPTLPPTPQPTLPPTPVPTVRPVPAATLRPVPPTLPPTFPPTAIPTAAPIAPPAAVAITHYVPTTTVSKPLPVPTEDPNVNTVAYQFAHRFDTPAPNDESVPGIPVRLQRSTISDPNSGPFHGVRSMNGYSAAHVAVSIPCGVRHVVTGLGLNEVTRAMSAIDQETGYIYIGGWGAGPYGVAVDAGLQKSSAQAARDEYAFYWKYGSAKPITSDMRFPCGGPDVVLELYPISSDTLLFSATGVNRAGQRVTLTVVQRTRSTDGWSPDGGGSNDGIILKRVVSIAQEDFVKRLASRWSSGTYFGIASPTDPAPQIVWRDCQIGHVIPPRVVPQLVPWTAKQTYHVPPDADLTLDYPPAGIVRGQGGCDASGIYLHR